MEKVKVVIDENIPALKEMLEGHAECKSLNGREINNEILKDAKALFVRSVTKVYEALLKDSAVEFTASATIGTDHVDLDFLESRGISFSAAPGSNANSVAEYIICCLLRLSEKYSFKLKGMTIGIVGHGNVGALVERKARALGMNILLNDPPKEEAGGEGYTELSELLHSSDIVSLHTPLSYEGRHITLGLADENFFSEMKEGAIFINSARGKICQSSALVNALKEGRLKAAVLDVFENEPAISSELAEHVDIITPHIAGYSYDGKVRGAFMVFEAFCRRFNIPHDNYSLEQFLPDESRHLELSCPQEDAFEENAAKAALMMYDPLKDDADLREVLKGDEPEKGFDALRKNYPKRREFSSMRLNILKGNCLDFANLLKSLGFKIER